MTTPCCGNCQHSKMIMGPDKQMYLACRRYPPQLMLLPNPQGFHIQPFFPTVHKDDVCGEFSPTIKQ